MIRPSVVFFGYGDNGAESLKALIKRKIKIKGIIISDKEKTNTIASLAKKYKVPLVTFTKTNKLVIIGTVKKFNPDLIIVSSFPYLLPRAIYQFPKYGAINIHAGKLPYYRGYHPLNWALINGEKEIGVTIHYINEGIDSGDILAQEIIEISSNDDINSLKEKAIKKGVKLLIDIVQQITRENKRLKGRKQDKLKATYAPKRAENDGKIDWSKTSREIFNLIRALKSPYPNAFSLSNAGNKINFHDNFTPGKPGQIIAKIKDQYLITTGDGVALLKTKQKLRVGQILQ